MPRELHRAARDVAKVRGVSITDVVTRALSSYLTEKCDVTLPEELPRLP